jgi:hypothetical protein
MNMPIGVRGTVVEDEKGPPFGAFSDLLIKAFFLPFLENLGFSAGETSLHGKGGFRKV